MKEKFGYKNDLSVPRIEKMVINIGVGKFLQQDSKILESISQDLALITGQKPVFTQAKKAISGFKTRKGMKIGLKVTLRGRRMYDFLERLINAALPRSRDFRGVSPESIDENGNLTLGIKEHIIFSEVSEEEIKALFGFEVTVVTSAKTKEEGETLLRLMGFPIKNM